MWCSFYLFTFFHFLLDFLFAACYGTWTFITTIFTHPRTPRAKRGNAFRQIQTYRPVYSEVRQCWMHHSHHEYPTPGIWAAPSTSGQVSCGIIPLTVAFCRLHRAFDRETVVYFPANRSIRVGVSARYPVTPPIGLLVLTCTPRLFSLFGLPVLMPIT